MSSTPPPDADAPATPSPELKKQRNRSYWIAGIIIVLLIVATAYFFDLKDLVAIAKQTNYLLVLLGVAFFLGGIFLIDVRWWYLLGRKQSFKTIAHATNTSYIVPILTPIPNYISRVVITGLATEASIPQATTAMLVERMIAQIMRITTIVMAVALGVQSTMSSTTMIRSVAISVGVLVLYLLAIRFVIPLTRALDKALGKISGLRDEHRRKVVDVIRDALSLDVGMSVLLQAVGMTIIMWTLFFLFYFMVIVAMPLGLDVKSGVTIALGSLALVPPSAPAMLGIFQLSMVGPNLILRLGTVEQLLPYSLMLYFIQAIVWGVLTLWGLRKMNMSFVDLFRHSRESQEAAAAKKHGGEEIDSAEKA